MLPRAAGRQPGSAHQRGALTDHGNSAAALQVRVRHAWQQGGDPLIGSTALYAACQRALQPGGVLIATSGRLARIADTPMPPCCPPPSMASVPTSAIPRRSPCYACPYLREACTRKQCITAGRRAVIYTGLRVVGRQVRQRASGRSVYLCIGGLGVNVRFCRVPVYWRVMVRGGGRGPMAGVGGLLVEGSRRIGETRDMGQGVAGSAGRVILAR